MLLSFIVTSYIIGGASSLSLFNSSLDIEYLNGANFTIHNDCSLSLEINIIDNNPDPQTSISKTLNMTHLELILYWTHLHIFNEINSKSWLYHIDHYTDNFWNDYYLDLMSLSTFNESVVSTLLSVDVCVSQKEIQEAISLELRTDSLSLFSLLTCLFLVFTYFSLFTFCT